MVRFRNIFKKIHVSIFTPLVLMLASWSSLPADARTDGLAEQVTSLAGMGRGVCAVLGADKPSLALELAADNKFVVHVIDPDRAEVERARAEAKKQGADGRRLRIEQHGYSALPYAGNMLDLLVASYGRDLETVDTREILRVLRPLGKAVIHAAPKDKAALEQWVSKAAGDWNQVTTDSGLWAVLTKPEPEGLDDWSHWEHAPDNNPVSADKVITAPYMSQFFGLPYYISMPSITTIAGGRTFTAVGHIAHHQREEPWLNTLYAQNGYNGTDLWSRKLPDGYLVHRSAFIATDETFYMIEPGGNGCVLLNPETGEEKGRISPAELAGDWKWIAISDGILYALAGEHKDPPQTTLVRSPARAWSWDDLSRGFYEKQIPWGFGNTLGAYDLAAGKLLWSMSQKQKIDSRGMVIGGGKLFYYGPDSKIVCLDALTGNIDWENSDPQVRSLIEEAGKGLTSTPGFRTSCMAVFTPGALIFQGQTRMNVVAVSTADGSLLWTRKKTINNPNILYVDGRVILGIGKGGSTVEADPLTGETIKDLGFRKKYCARLTATHDSYFCRGQFEGLARYDRATGKLQFNGALRPACNDGVIGANGLLYMGPWLCDCNLSLVGRIVLCSDQGFDFRPSASWQNRLELEKDGLSVVEPLKAGPRDWPTYRSDIQRSGATAAEIPVSVGKSWYYTPEVPFSPTPATAAGGLIFMGGDDGKVRAIDAASGEEVWSYYTAGPILQPPTIWQGRAYVGSGDGYIYALEAATGRLLWRFRAAPVERRIMVYGSLSSTWPVHTGVLVHDGVAYAAAGIVDYDGTYVYALDAVSGELKWQNTSSGHLDAGLRKGVSAMGMLTVAQGKLWLAGGNIVSPASFDIETGEYTGRMPGDGRPQANRGEEIGLFAGRVLYVGGRLMHSPRENVVNPGRFTAFRLDGEDGAERISDFCVGRVPPAWNEQRFVVVNSRYKMPWELKGRMLEAGQHGMPACFPSSAAEEYFAGGEFNDSERWVARNLKDAEVVSVAIAPNAVLTVSESWVLRHRKTRWAVSSMELADGELMWEQELDGPALSGGLTVDRGGRVIVVLTDGRLACFAGGVI